MILLVLVSASWVSNRPRLTILVNGQPPQGATIASGTWVGGTNNAPLSFDQRGNVVFPSGAPTPEVVIVRTADGTEHWVHFPRRGHKTLDIRPRYSSSETVLVDWGFSRYRERSSSYSFTDEEVEQVKNGELTLEEIQRRIEEQEGPNG